MGGKRNFISFPISLIIPVPRYGAIVGRFAVLNISFPKGDQRLRRYPATHGTRSLIAAVLSINR